MSEIFSAAEIDVLYFLSENYNSSEKEILVRVQAIDSRAALKNMIARMVRIGAIESNRDVLFSLSVIGKVLTGQFEANGDVRVDLLKKGITQYPLKRTNRQTWEKPRPIPIETRTDDFLSAKAIFSASGRTRRTNEAVKQDTANSSMKDESNLGNDRAPIFKDKKLATTSKEKSEMQPETKPEMQSETKPEIKIETKSITTKQTHQAGAFLMQELNIEHFQFTDSELSILEMVRVLKDLDASDFNVEAVKSLIARRYISKSSGAINASHIGRAMLSGVPVMQGLSKIQLTRAEIIVFETILNNKQGFVRMGEVLKRLSGTGEELGKDELKVMLETWVKKGYVTLQSNGLYCFTFAVRVLAGVAKYNERVDLPLSRLIGKLGLKEVANYSVFSGVEASDSKAAGKNEGALVRKRKAPKKKNAAMPQGDLNVSLVKDGAMDNTDGNMEACEPNMVNGKIKEEVMIERKSGKPVNNKPVKSEAVKSEPDEVESEVSGWLDGAIKEIEQARKKMILEGHLNISDIDKKILFLSHLKDVFFGDEKSMANSMVLTIIKDYESIKAVNEVKNN